MMASTANCGQVNIGGSPVALQGAPEASLRNQHTPVTPAQTYHWVKTALLGETIGCATAQRNVQSFCELIQAVDRLLTLADDLRRDNASKWALSLAEWQAAVDDVLVKTDSIRDASLAEVCRAVRAAVRRLANSGEARFDSVSVGRLPGSSLAGQRFCDDLEALQRCAERLRADC
jgi:hypothetical protein